MGTLTRGYGSTWGMMFPANSYSFVLGASAFVVAFPSMVGLRPSSGNSASLILSLALNDGISKKWKFTYQLTSLILKY